MIDNKLTNLTTIETIATTGGIGGTKYICLCGHHKVEFPQSNRNIGIVSYAAERVKKDMRSMNDCSKYCSDYGYDKSFCLEINENYEYYDDGSDSLNF